MNSLLYQTLELITGSAVGPLRTNGELAGLQGAGSLPAILFSPSDEMLTTLAGMGYAHTCRLAAIPSRRNPRWLLPIGSLPATLAGTQVYMPHKWLPRAAMTAFTRALKLGAGSWLSSNIVIASKEPLGLATLVRDVTGEKDLMFALSIGRRLTVRKLTLQVMRPNGQVLGYMKLPLSEDAQHRVRHEAAALERLWGFPALRPHIPRLLHAGSWNDRYLLFQSPIVGQLGPSSFTPAHKDFLQTLWSVSQTRRSGRSLVEEIGPKWDKVVATLGSNWKSLGQEVLRRSTQDLDGQTILCGISHGDFAPWNTRVHEGKLLLFDWESTHWAAPTQWDVCHFALQTSVSFRRKFDIGLPANADRVAYRLYLLNSVIQFVQEGNASAIEYRRKLLANELQNLIIIKTADPVSTGRPPQGTGRQFRKVTRISKMSTDSPPRIVTTSWDDGDPQDVRVADLLRGRGMAGTFYIPIHSYSKNGMMEGSDLRALAAQGFEIGAHSLSHKSLTRIDKKEMQDEVSNCKRRLEEIVGKEVSMFCYPNGRYNADVIDQVKFAGYQGARTTWMLSTKTAFLPFEMPTTLQAFPHPPMGYVRDLGRARDFSGLWRFSTELRHAHSWIELGKKLFGEVLEHGGIWHLYGHSWEIEDLKMWDQLREMLDYVSRREGVLYLTNGQSISRLKDGNLPRANDYLEGMKENSWLYQQQGSGGIAIQSDLSARSSPVSQPIES